MSADKIPTEEEKKSETERQIRIIHRMAARLPWITVVVIVIVMILTLIEAFLG